MYAIVGKCGHLTIIATWNRTRYTVHTNLVTFYITHFRQKSSDPIHYYAIICVNYVLCQLFKQLLRFLAFSRLLPSGGTRI